MSQLYNEELKELFLINYENKPTQDYYRQTFSVLTFIEKQLFKDIKDFNKVELISSFNLFKSKTLDSLDSRVTILRQYLDFCMENKFITENVLKNISRDDYEKQVEETDRIIYSREELYNICDSASNAQDAVIFTLLFEGVKGLKYNSEITNLRTEDIILNENKIIIKDNNTKYVAREVIVSKRTIDIVKKAIEEKIYYKNIINEDTLKASLERELNMTSYLIKPVSYNKKDKDEPVGSQVIDSRIKRCVKQIDKKWITAKTVYLSGILVELKELEDNKGTLTIQDFKYIVKKHGGNENNCYSIREQYTKYFK
jgi:integrase